ncbi:MAG: hypothetical protein ACLQE9_01525 [Roseiarcus sp.]|jgi:hypothetical protein
MRRRTLLSCLLLATVLSPGMPARADEFVPGTEDLPLMPGLAPIDGSSLVFDKPEGRIVEAQAKGKLARGDVARFYAQTLPQLGWSAAGTDLWRREGERLKLDYRGPDGNLTVSFTLSPSPQ